MYGDSYIAGVSGANTSIPALLDAALPHFTVQNYDVDGYGIDQTSLRLDDGVRRCLTIEFG